MVKLGMIESQLAELPRDGVQSPAGPEVILHELIGWEVRTPSRSSWNCGKAKHPPQYPTRYFFDAPQETISAVPIRMILRPGYQP
jgi:hypothetical protein